MMSENTFFKSVVCCKCISGKLFFQCNPTGFCKCISPVSNKVITTVSPTSWMTCNAVSTCLGSLIKVLSFKHQAWSYECDEGRVQKGETPKDRLARFLLLTKYVFAPIIALQGGCRPDLPQFIPGKLIFLCNQTCLYFSCCHAVNIILIRYVFFRSIWSFILVCPCRLSVTLYFIKSPNLDRFDVLIHCIPSLNSH